MFAGHIRDWRVELIWRVIYHKDNCQLSRDTILYYIEYRQPQHSPASPASHHIIHIDSLNKGKLPGWLGLGWAPAVKMLIYKSTGSRFRARLV